MRVDRRRFLMGGLAASAARAAGGYAPKMAVQAFIWTQEMRKQNRTLADGLEDIFAGSARAGFKNVELMSIFFRPELRGRTTALIKQHGFGVPIVYNGGPMHTAEGAEKTIAETLELADVVKQAGTKTLNVNPTPKPNKELKTDQELKAQVDAVNRLGKELRKKGMQLILHHHDPEMMENAREWRHLLTNTSWPLCIDLMWVARGGQDPMAILREAGRRVASLHVRNMRDGVCTEAFGDGEIDYAQVTAHLKKIGYQGWVVVELFHEPGTKVTRPLVENLRLSREYAEKVFGL